MDGMKRVALLGDLVDSRLAADRPSLHERVLAALADADPRATAVDPLHVTVGDEFQGVFPTTGAALGAAYRVRTALAGVTDVRFGLGRGEVVVIDATRNLQDGSAWWAARDAITTVEGRARAAHRALRTGLVAAPDAEPFGPALRAAVECVDALLHRLDARSWQVLALLLEGASQAEAAAAVGVSPSAVSQRVARDALAVLADAIARLEEEP